MIVRGECNFQSQRREVAQTFSHESEITRELYSNSHDAFAKHIHVWPRFGFGTSMLVWLDDGRGMDDRVRNAQDNDGCNGFAKTSIESFFHIGNSTRRAGKGVGHKCVGAKLVLAQADRFFLLVTRTEAMPDDTYFVVLSEDVNAALDDRNGGVTAQPMSLEKARTLACELVDRLDDGSVEHDYATTLSEAFDALRAHPSGTLQAYVACKTPLHTSRLLDTRPFSEGGLAAWAPPKHGSRMIAHDIERTNLIGCLRFASRHGTVLHDATGAFETTHNSFSRYPKIFEAQLRKANLYVHAREGCDSLDGVYTVPYGFPFIEHRTEASVTSGNTKAKLRCRTSLHARFGPRIFTANERHVTVLLCIDSLNDRLEVWEALKRTNCPNGKRCGIDHKRFTNIVLCTQGVTITRADGLQIIDRLPVGQPRCTLSDNERDSFRALLQDNKESNAVLFIDFTQIDLKMDRNDITPAAYEALRHDEDFLLGLANTLHDFLHNTHNGKRAADVNVLQHVLSVIADGQKLRDEESILEYSHERVLQTLRAWRVTLVPRNGVPDGARAILSVVREAMCVPMAGHEAQLCGMYDTLGRVVRALVDMLPRDAYPVFHRLAHWWWRVGLNFNAMGVDYQFFEWPHTQDRFHAANPRAHTAVMRQGEVKIDIDGRVFKHPFQGCDLILLQSVRFHNGDVIRDSKDNTGTIHFPDESDDLYDVGCYVVGITRQMRQVMMRHDATTPLKIPVLSFEKLLAKTFEEVCEVHHDRPSVGPDASKKRSRSARK